MKTLTVPIPDFSSTLARVLVLFLAIAGLGFAAWLGMRPPPVDDGGSFVERPDVTPSNGYGPNNYSYQGQPVVYRDRETSGSECSQWDLSPVAMEAILQEM